MVKAVWIHETGGPDALTIDDVEVAAPGAGEVTLRHTVLGLNYIDIGMREGHYQFVKVPMAMGMEAAGVVEDVGPGVKGFAPGDRVSTSKVRISSSPSIGRSGRCARSASSPRDVPAISISEVSHDL